ncbi:hypothetical protein M1C57_14295 [Rhodococcus pyridinivorans]|uniref:hypothetical protein n=1 Tax=Rhodococcus pyridinivorans TaxID=103816 RepID=UPI00200B994A|nr:hypothetical protein [Rhodococcus pyridinivorans]UPW02874.1 hypothetical protein M1C57_14295 [Rhodococcus pyridinivorans]
MPTITATSMFDRNRTVEIDPYGLNPLLEDYRGVNPLLVDIATRQNGEPPKMFLSGLADLPEFTASGIPPTSLLRLPFGVRHAAAAEPNLARAQHLFEQYADWPGAIIDHRGLRDAIARFTSWLTRLPAQPAPNDEETWDAIFGSSGTQRPTPQNNIGYRR